MALIVTIVVLNAQANMKLNELNYSAVAGANFERKEKQIV